MLVKRHTEYKGTWLDEQPTECLLDLARAVLAELPILPSLSDNSAK
jgi:hypothetical protein